MLACALFRCDSQVPLVSILPFYLSLVNVLGRAMSINLVGAPANSASPISASRRLGTGGGRGGMQAR